MSPFFKWGSFTLWGWERVKEITTQITTSITTNSIKIEPDHLATCTQKNRFLNKQVRFLKRNHRPLREELGYPFNKYQLQHLLHKYNFLLNPNTFYIPKITEKNSNLVSQAQFKMQQENGHVVPSVRNWSPINSPWCIWCIISTFHWNVPSRYIFMYRCKQINVPNKFHILAFNWKAPIYQAISDHNTLKIN